MSINSDIYTRHLGSVDLATGSPANEALENYNTTTLDDGALCYVSGGAGAGMWQLERDATDTPDGVEVVAPAAGGPGRWIKRWVPGPAGGGGLPDAFQVGTRITNALFGTAAQNAYSLVSGTVNGTVGFGDTFTLTNADGSLVYTGPGGTYLITLRGNASWTSSVGGNCILLLQKNGEIVANPPSVFSCPGFNKLGPNTVAWPVSISFPFELETGDIITPVVFGDGDGVNVTIDCPNWVAQQVADAA